MKRTLYKRPPLRTCVACRQVKEKVQLVRLVRTVDGSVKIAEGRETGRGAYICRKGTCWQEGLKGDKLERALRTKLSQELREQLRHQAVIDGNE